MISVLAKPKKAGVVHRLPVMIFAGNLRQAAAYAREHRLLNDRWVFAADRRALEGRDPLAYETVRHGTWNENYQVAGAYGEWLQRQKKAENQSAQE
jgi:hypothetical protein